MSDASRDLIGQASRGDAGAVSRLLERHLPALRAYIRLRMGPKLRRWETESDVAQSVCVEALKNLNGRHFRGEATFRHWLFQAAQHKLVALHRYHHAARRDTDRLASEQREDALGDGDPVDRAIFRALGSPSEYAVRRETLERIHQALDRMSEETREVVALSRLAGLSNPEIAKILGRPESTVRSTLSRGLVKLARALRTR